MNIYRYTFAAACPNNGQSIIYLMTLKTDKRIFVEHITLACGLIKSAFHEDIAQILFERFSGELTLTATHHGVDIETVLS